ncbi:uncharacterized protein LOC141672221 isoform X1 [Apium graveolens]|uniref:uncharacterized protein LOC141672221 isoform X1 n=1 Tax=Apium graveolens TaxID=4045 RepID=UPI003D793895
MMMESYYALLYKSPLKQAFTDSRRRICCSSTGGSCTLRLGQIKADIKNRFTLPQFLILKNFEGLNLGKRDIVDESGFGFICCWSDFIPSGVDRFCRNMHQRFAFKLLRESMTR